MSNSKEQREATNALCFPQKPPISSSENEDKVYNPPFQSDFSNFNDSNSDDTQFESQSGELNSNDISPVKEKTVLEHARHRENTEQTNKCIKQECIPCDQEGIEGKVLQPGNSNSLDNTDATSFVDYFLAHDDLLQALDDYSRSVGQTSVFPLETAPVPSSHHEKYYTPTDLCNPSPSLQEGNIIHANSIVTDNGQCHKEVRNEGLSQDINCEKRKERSKQSRGKGRFDSRQSKSVTVQRRSEKRKPRTYSQAIPSQHCHICSRRPTETSPHAVCGNLLKGRCRKTICTKCFHQFRWDLKAARDAPPGTWECPHCRGECPQRAQCVIYNRTSDRRRMKLINHRKKKDQTKVTGDRKYENSKASGKTEFRTESPDSGTTAMNRFETANSCSSSQTVARTADLLKTEKTSLQSSSISKPVRSSGMSSYGQFAYMANEVSHQVILEGDARNEWDSSGIITSTAEMTSLELGPKVVGFDQAHQLEMKSELDLLGRKGLEADGSNGSEDVTGIFSCMGFPDDALHVTTANSNEAGTGMIEQSGNEGLHTNLGLLDIEKSFERKNGDSETDHGRLSFWDQDDVKYEQMEVEEFAFNENRLDLNTIL